MAWDDYEIERNRLDFDITTTHVKADPRKLEKATPDPDYRFAEGDYIKELKSYIDSTYGEHYARDKIQATEFIIDSGHGEGFCIGNVMKYAKRYGKKNGKNKHDLLKVLHYALIMLHVHDQNEGNR